MAYGKDPERPRAPHWMRSMEEKYQRLHAKITDQAARYSQSRNSLSVRLREMRQRNYIAERRSSSKSASDDAKDYSLESQKGLSNQSHDRTRPVSSAVDLQNSQNPRLKHPCFFDKIDSANGYVRIKSCGNGADKRSSSTTALAIVPLTNEITKPLTGDGNSPPVCAPHEELSSKKIDSSSKEISGNDNDLRKSNQYNQFKKDNSLLSSDVDDLDKSVEEERLYVEKELKRVTRPFSVPRVRDTNSRCHHFLEDEHETEVWKTNPNRSKTLFSSSSNRKISTKSATALHHGQHTEHPSEPVFSSMSQEAQHAKHETLKAMTWAGGVHDDLRGGCDAIAVSYIKENTDNAEECDKVEAKTNTNNNIQTIFKDFTEGLNLKPDILSKHESSSGSNVITNDKEPVTKHGRSIRQKLRATPCMDAGKQLDDVQRLQSPNHQKAQSKQQLERSHKVNHDFLSPYRSPLPAIRQTFDWHSHREHSFDITSPDFDVRFCESLAYPKEECEAPPEDIRRQSIEKCRLWLERQLGGL